MKWLLERHLGGSQTGAFRVLRTCHFPGTPVCVTNLQALLSSAVQTSHWVFIMEARCIQSLATRFDSVFSSLPHRGWEVRLTSSGSKPQAAKRVAVLPTCTATALPFDTHAHKQSYHKLRCGLRSPPGMTKTFLSEQSKGRGLLSGHQEQRADGSFTTQNHILTVRAENTPLFWFFVILRRHI